MDISLLLKQQFYIVVYLLAILSLINDVRTKPAIFFCFNFLNVFMISQMILATARASLNT